MSAKDALSDQFGKQKQQGMISLDLPHGVVPTVPGDLEDKHITIAFLGDDVDDTAYERATKEAQRVASSTRGPLTGTVGGVDTFPPNAEGKKPAFAVPNVAGVQDLHNQLSHLDAGNFSEYHPHVTIKMLDAGEPLPAPVKTRRVSFSHIAVHRGDQVERFPFR